MDDWLLIASAPVGIAIEVAIIDRNGFNVFEVPVRRTEAGWLNAETGARPGHQDSVGGRRLDIDPAALAAEITGVDN